MIGRICVQLHLYPIKIEQPKEVNRTIKDSLEPVLLRPKWLLIVLLYLSDFVEFLLVVGEAHDGKEVGKEILCVFWIFECLDGLRMDAQQIGKALIYLIFVALWLNFLLVLHNDWTILLVLWDSHLISYLKAFHFHLLPRGFIAAPKTRLLLLVLAFLLIFMLLCHLLCFFLHFLWWLVLVILLWGAYAFFNFHLLLRRSFLDRIEGNLLELNVVLFIFLFFFLYHFIMALQ